MKTQRFAIVVTLINLVILALTWAQGHPASAQDTAPVLRGRGLQIVDDRGKLRAEIVVVPAATARDGQKYPNTVLLRLIDPNGRPGVKLDTSADGSGLLLTGDSERKEWSGVQLSARVTGSSVKLLNRDGRQQLIQP
jgi:hypothetical protein